MNVIVTRSLVEMVGNLAEILVWCYLNSSSNILVTAIRIH